MNGDGESGGTNSDLYLETATNMVLVCDYLDKASGCWSTATHAVVLTLMREHYYCVYLYMLCRLTY